MSKKPLVIFGQAFILKRNPWFSRRLRLALSTIGKIPKKAEYILATPPPWFGKRYEAMSPAQIQRLIKFSEVASATAGMKVEERLKILHEKLATGRKPRPSRAKPVGTRFHEVYRAIPTPTAVTPAPRLRTE